MAHRPGSGQPPQDQQPYGQQWASQQPRDSRGRQYAPQDQHWQQQPQQDAPWQRYGPAEEQWEPTPAPSGQPQRAPQRSVPERHGRPPGFLYAGIALVAGIVIGGAAGYALHGSTPAAAGTGNAAAAATTPTAPATPDTAAAAKSAAASFLAVYSAGQWQAAWQHLAPADQKIAPEKLYVDFHDACPSEAAGMAYKIESVTMAGKAAVVTYTIPVVEKVLGSATIAEDWTASGWRQEFTSGSASDYQHGGLKADVAAAKAAGECASS
jgi:hypothetical protein